MKPLSLTMTAFGPFADTQKVNFQVLQRERIFLIHGPTGAGKTSILDGICFALYGDTSGAERNGKQMRCHLSSPEVQTQVDFIFSLHGQIYRVQRSPEQTRPKRRGDGLVTIAPEATLWQRAPVGEHLVREPLEGNLDGAPETVRATGWQKVTESIEQLLGFRSAQFRQVVILPQGQFRRLLTADSKERQVILETLFHTEIYSRIQEGLKQKARDLQRALEKIQVQQQWVLQQAQVEEITELKALYDQHLTQFKAVERQFALAKDRVATCRQELMQGQLDQTKFQEKVQAQKAFQELQRQIPAVEKDRQIWVESSKALKLLDVEENLRTLAENTQQASRVLQEKEKEFQWSQKAWQQAEKQKNEEFAREPERETAVLARNQLTGFIEKVSALALLEREKEQAEQVFILARDKLSAQQKVCQEQQREIERLTGELEQTTAVTHQTEGRKWKYEEAKSQMHRRKQLAQADLELEKLQKLLHNAQDRVNGVLENYQIAKEKFADSQQAWNQGQAAVLAEQLQVGQPCPVCGSLTHPNPRPSSAMNLKERDLESLSLRVERLEQWLDKEKETLAAHTLKQAKEKSQAEHLRQELGEKVEFSIADHENRVRLAEKNWQQAQIAGQAEPRLRKQLHTLREALQQSQAELAQTEKGQQKAHLSLKEMEIVIQEREGEIPQELRSIGALKTALQGAEERVQELKNRLDQAQKNAAEAMQSQVRAQTALEVSRQNQQEIQERLQLAKEAFQQRLFQVGFPDQETYWKARRTPGEIQGLADKMELFDRQIHEAQERLNRAQQNHAGLEEPNIPQLSLALRSAEEQAEAIQNQWMNLQAQIKREEQGLNQLEELSKKIQQAQKQFQEIGFMADVANGKNPLGITFQRFVLGSFLEDVTITASARLKVMSRGRYQIQRAFERSHARSPGGLGIEIFDSYTGLERSVHTLSGGEAFLASLSLALGLADVVQAYSGGILLDTIFVDEGFGSLDSETLDLALQALVDAQQEGRLVGIVSHVSELKERISAQIEVQVSQRGSQIQLKKG